MSFPHGSDYGKDKQVDPEDRLILLAQLRATVSELLKEAMEGHREKPHENASSSSQPGRDMVMSLGLLMMPR